MPRLKEVTHLLNEWTPTRGNQMDGKPAELYDAHPLSEMLISAETESVLSPYLIRVENSWRSEWHKNGVQVPVCQADELKKRTVKCVKFSKPLRQSSCNFRSTQLWHESCDTRYDEEHHQLCSADLRITPIYHLDSQDRAWMSIVNEERECLDLTIITEPLFERIMEALEELVYVKMYERSKELEVQALEFDENAKCDICLSYEGEDGNELVFCDGCLLCVHQACYGILRLPEGAWICRQCEAGVKSTTPCALCPNTGGAMKMTDDKTQWCHVSCALWVPEVGFGDFELVEPIVRLNEIPQARRNLVCVICRSRCGAPIQCSKKTCRVAFHVTCAFQSNLTMRQELSDKDVHLMGFCPKHSHKDGLQKAPNSPNQDVSKTTKRTPVKNTNSSNSVPTNVGPSNPILSRKQRLLELENNFHALIDDEELQSRLSNGNIPVCSVSEDMVTANSKSKKKNRTIDTREQIADDIRSAVTTYWRLKRRTNFNQPLVWPPPPEWRRIANRSAESTKEAVAAAARATADMHVFDAFRRIRFGLDRSRLVVDMVLQRERKKASLFQKMWRIFEIQAYLLKRKYPPQDWSLFSGAHMGNTIYDNWEIYDSCQSSKLSKSAPPLSVQNDQNQSGSSHNLSAKNLLDPTSPRKQDVTSGEQHPPTEPTDHYDQNIHIIPYDHLIVPEDVKQRLRTALSFVSLYTARPLEDAPLIPSKTRKIRPKCLPLSMVPYTDVQDHSTNGNVEFCTPVAPPPSKRLKLTKHTLSPQPNVISNSPIPILSKLATIKQSTGALQPS